MAANWREKGKEQRRNENKGVEEGRGIRERAWRKREKMESRRQCWRLLGNPGSKRDYTDDETKTDS